MGTSPLVYVDTHRMIHRDEDGNPKGVNSGVFKTIAKMLVSSTNEQTTFEKFCESYLIHTGCSERLTVIISRNWCLYQEFHVWTDRHSAYGTTELCNN